MASFVGLSDDDAIHLPLSQLQAVLEAMNGDDIVKIHNRFYHENELLLESKEHKPLVLSPLNDWTHYTLEHKLRVGMRTKCELRTISPIIDGDSDSLPEIKRIIRAHWMANPGSRNVVIVLTFCNTGVSNTNTNTNAHKHKHKHKRKRKRNPKPKPKPKHNFKHKHTHGQGWGLLDSTAAN